MPRTYGATGPQGSNDEFAAILRGQRPSPVMRGRRAGPSPRRPDLIENVEDRTLRRTREKREGQIYRERLKQEMRKTRAMKYGIAEQEQMLNMRDREMGLREETFAADVAQQAEQSRLAEMGMDQRADLAQREQDQRATMMERKNAFIAEEAQRQREAEMGLQDSEENARALEAQRKREHDVEMFNLQNKPKRPGIAEAAAVTDIYGPKVGGPVMRKAFSEQYGYDIPEDAKMKADPAVVDKAMPMVEDEELGELLYEATQEKGGDLTDAISYVKTATGISDPAAIQEIIRRKLTSAGQTIDELGNDWMGILQLFGAKSTEGIRQRRLLRQLEAHYAGK